MRDLRLPSVADATQNSNTSDATIERMTTDNICRKILPADEKPQ